MKTSILYGKDYGRRCFLPDEHMQQGAPVDYGVARFQPEHKYQFSTFSNTQLRTRTKPDMIAVGSYDFSVGYHRGAHLAAKTSSKAPVVIAGHYGEKIHEIDEQINALTRKRQVLMEEAGKKGRPLTVNDLELPCEASDE